MLSRSLVVSSVACAVALSGCGPRVRYFRVSSYPEGAVVYVDGEPRGETNFERLGIEFEPEGRLVTLRLEKAGYQSAGAVLGEDSPRHLAFFLQETPRNAEILQVLKSILEALDRLSAELKRESETRR